MSFILKSLCIGIILSGQLKSQGESIPLYYISKSEKDSTLKITEALFEIHFQGYGAKIDLSKEIIISCNGVIIKAKPNAKGIVSIPVSPGKYKFEFFYDEDFFEIKTSSFEIKPGFRNKLEVNFMSSKYPVSMDKPVVYFYPQKTTDVSVKLNLKGKLDFTYPQYQPNKGWNFIAHPNGKLNVNGKEHNYLFWEGTTHLDLSDRTEQNGFVVQKENIVAFLENKLSKMGFNPNEKEDFITYWGPIMSQHDQCFVHFMFNQEYSNYATLTINPKPDHLFRVFMLWSSVEKGQYPTPEPQVIPSFSRTGFSVVEWGGSDITKLLKRQKALTLSTY